MLECRHQKWHGSGPYSACPRRAVRGRGALGAFPAQPPFRTTHVDGPEGATSGSCAPSRAIRLEGRPPARGALSRLVRCRDLRSGRPPGTRPVGIRSAVTVPPPAGRSQGVSRKSHRPVRREPRRVRGRVIGPSPARASRGSQPRSVFRTPSAPAREVSGDQLPGARSGPEHGPEAQPSGTPERQTGRTTAARAAARVPARVIAATPATATSPTATVPDQPPAWKASAPTTLPALDPM